MSERYTPVPETAATTRRTVLRAAGLAALTGGGVAALGACTAEGETGTPASSAPAPSASSAPASSSAPAESPSASAEAKPTPSEAPVPEGPSVGRSDVPVGGGVILEDADYVVTQPTRGKFKAFSKICTHQQCPVTAIEGGSINCQCHGSKFSIKDGSVQKGPATKPLAEAKVTVAGDEVVVTA
jgi:Rieske Fe-S protein